MAGRFRVRPSLWAAAAVLLLAGAMLAMGIRSPDLISREAIVTEAVCRQLTLNTTEGRQALVSSVWWPPLPALLRLPVAALMPAGQVPVSSVLVSSLFGLGLAMLLIRIMRDWKLGPLRYVFAAALVLNPFVLRECLSGSSTTTLMFLAVLSAGALVQWIALRQVRWLVTFAAGTALMVATGFGFAVWALLLFLLFLIDLAVCRLGWRRKEASFILGILPAAHMVGLWILMNWLIMGDGLYFLRSLHGWKEEHGGILASLSGLFDEDNLQADSPAAAWRSCLVPAGIAALVAFMALLKRNWAGVCMGLLIISPCAAMWPLASWGILWDPAPMFMSMLPLSLLGLAYVAGRLDLARARLGPLTSLAALALIASALFHFESARFGLPAPGEYDRVMAERNRQLWRIERHVLGRSPWAKVFVCGYDSLLLLGPDRGAVFEHALDLDFNRLKRDYAGHALFVLIHRPVGRSAMDSIHWKYDKIFTLGVRSTLYDSDWGDWRLLEVIQAPRK